MNYKKFLLGLILSINIMNADDILKFSYISQDNKLTELSISLKNIINCESLKGFNKNMIDESVYKDFQILSDNNLTVKYSTCSFKDKLKVLAYIEYKKDKIVDQTAWNIFISKGRESVGNIQTKSYEKKIFILKYE
jgi:predicted small secreted protein